VTPLSPSIGTGGETFFTFIFTFPPVPTDGDSGVAHFCFQQLITPSIGPGVETVISQEFWVFSALGRRNCMILFF
jgi:hypothetical protein